MPHRLTGLYCGDGTGGDERLRVERRARQHQRRCCDQRALRMNARRVVGEPQESEQDRDQRRRNGRHQPVRQRRVIRMRPSNASRCASSASDRNKRNPAAVLAALIRESLRKWSCGAGSTPTLGHKTTTQNHTVAGD